MLLKWFHTFISSNPSAEYYFVSPDRLSMTKRYSSPFGVIGVNKFSMAQKFLVTKCKIKGGKNHSYPMNDDGDDGDVI